MIAPTDLQKFSALMPLLYTPRSIEEFPEHALSLLGKLMNLDELVDNCVNLPERQVIPNFATGAAGVMAAPANILGGNGANTRNLGALSSSETVSSPQRIEIQRRERWKNEFPIFTHYFHAHEGAAKKISDFSIESNFYRVEGVYWRFFKPIRIDDRMGKIFTDPLHPATTHAIYPLQADAICLTISRSHQTLSERDRQMLDLIRPHLIQAYQNAVKFTEIQTQLTQHDRVLSQSGLLLLSATGDVLLMTERAWQLLNQYFEPCSPTNLPKNLRSWLQERIAVANGTDHSQVLPTIVPLQIEKSGQQLSVDLIPYPATEQYLVQIKEHQSPLSIESLQLLGLTKREAEVLCSIAKDQGNAEIAKFLNCSLGTVKKHLEHIYEKLEVQTRTAAVIKALQGMGVI